MENNSQFNPIVVVKGTGKKPPFFKRIQAPFSKLSLPNKKFAGAIVALLLVFGVGVGTFLVQKQTQLAPKASENGVDLRIDPAAVNATLNQEFSVDVVLDAKQASASAAQVKVTFDTQKLQLVSTTLGSFMPVALQQPTNSAGAVEFVVGTSTPRGGSGSIATLRFKPLIDLTTTTITLDPANTIVTVINMNENQAGDITPSTVTVGTVSASPSATSSAQPQTALKINSVTPPNVGQEFNVPVYARSDIEHSNVFVAKINFPKDLLEVVSVNDDNSFITNWVEQFYDNQTGQISLVGGVPTPGYKSENTDVVMAVVRFRAKAAGTALLDMTSQSQIFSNATNQNILQITQDVSFPISGGAASPSPVACQEDSQCSTGYYCQITDGACTNTEPGTCTVFGECRPNSSKPSPSIAPEASPSPSAGASASPNCATLKGDGNGDCVVNLTDLSIMLSNFSATNPVPAGKQLLDFNNDNRINTFDFSSMADKLFQLGIIKRRS